MFNKKNFSDETKQQVHSALNGYCCVKGCYNRIEDFHHRLHNFKSRQEEFSLFLQSVLNCGGVCRECHNNYAIHPELNITIAMAELFENFLRKLKEE